MHVKKGDTVLVLSGKDKDKKAKVLEANPQERKVLVEGVNVMKKHTKPRPPKIPQGGILEKAMPIHADKVMLICPNCGKPTRPSARIKDQIKERLCKKCNQVIS